MQAETREAEIKAGNKHENGNIRDTGMFSLQRKAAPLLTVGLVFIATKAKRKNENWITASVDAQIDDQ